MKRWEKYQEWMDAMCFCKPFHAFNYSPVRAGTSCFMWPARPCLHRLPQLSPRLPSHNPTLRRRSRFHLFHFIMSFTCVPHMWISSFENILSSLLESKSYLSSRPSLDKKSPPATESRTDERRARAKTRDQKGHDEIQTKVWGWRGIGNTGVGCITYFLRAWCHLINRHCVRILSW